MQSKSLTVAAFILGLGVVAGCDDPEVQDKVLNVLEHGMVDAYLECTNITWNVCTPTYSDRLEINKFVDGSSYFDIKGTGTYSPTFHGFKHRGKNFLEFSFVLANGAEWTAEIDGGVLEIYSQCIGQTPPTESGTASLESFCTGYNLEAFGITP
jgi:hypothetical protein